jgi:hypothetical protein
VERGIEGAGVGGERWDRYNKQSMTSGTYRVVVLVYRGRKWSKMGAEESSIKERILMTRYEYSILREDEKYDEYDSLSPAMHALMQFVQWRIAQRLPSLHVADAIHVLILLSCACGKPKLLLDKLAPNIMLEIELIRTGCMLVDDLGRVWLATSVCRAKQLLATCCKDVALLLQKLSQPQAFT